MDVSERAIPSESAHFLMEEARSRYLFALKFIKRGDTVLDLACGSGYGSSILSKKAHMVFGIDIDNEAVEYSISHYGNQSTVFLNSTAENTLFRDNLFDCIVAFEMIEHVNKANVLLNEVKRILKPHGQFILSTPNKEVVSPKGGVMSPYHTKEYTYEELTRLLSKYFKNIKIYSQTKSPQAQKALTDFMKSQNSRQQIVNSDLLNFRRLVPRRYKEKVWRYVGALFGRQTQESLNTSDFPIKPLVDSKMAEYFVAVCSK